MSDLIPSPMASPTTIRRCANNLLNAIAIARRDGMVSMTFGATVLDLERAERLVATMRARAAQIDRDPAERAWREAMEANQEGKP